MSDPFATLGLFDGFEAGAISAAFAAAVRAGIPISDARTAMDILRDPLRREAATLLAPSMSPAASQRRAGSQGLVADDGAIDTVLRFLAQVLVELDKDLVARAVVPSRQHDVDSMLPPMPGYLEP